MLNLVQLQERLKDLPMQAIMQYANGANPQVPPFLALGELNRRKKMQESAQAEQAKEMAGAPSVKEQLEQATGIMALQAQQPQQMPQQAAPQQMAAPMPAVGMAKGGITRGMDPEMLKKMLVMAALKKRGGIDQLPMRSDMFKRGDYAGGGIVAFQEGGAADVINAALEEQETADEFEGMELSPLQKLRIKKMKEQQGLPGVLERRKAFGLPEEAPDTTARTRADLERREKELQGSDTFINRLLALEAGRFGSGKMGKSMMTYEQGRQAKMDEIRKLRAAAEDQREAAKIAYKEGRFADYERGLAEARKLDIEAIKDVADIGRIEAQTKQATEGRSTNLKDMAQVEFQALVAKGRDPNDPATMQEAYRNAAAYVTYAGPRAEIQGQQARTAAARESSQDYEAAAKIVDPMIALGGSRRKEYRDILKDKGQAAADKFREDLIQNELRRMRGQGSGDRSASGSVRVTAPNGQIFTFPNQEAADKFKASAGIK